jgi:hypothetical protein
MAMTCGGLSPIVDADANIQAIGIIKIFFFIFFFFFHHNIVYSKSPVYNNLNSPGVNIKGPCFT